MAMLGQKAGLTIVRNVNAIGGVADGEPAWRHVANAMRRERNRPQSEIAAEFGAGLSEAIARSLSRIERTRKTARRCAVAY